MGGSGGLVGKLGVEHKLGWLLTLGCCLQASLLIVPYFAIFFLSKSIFEIHGVLKTGESTKTAPPPPHPTLCSLP